MEFLWGDPYPGTGAWLVASLVIAVVRVAFSVLQLRRSPAVRGRDTGRLTRWALSLGLLNAGLWTACSVVHLSAGSQNAEIVLHVVMSAVAMGATQHLSAFPVTLRLYVSLTLVPLVLRDLWIGGPEHLGLAVLCTIILFYTMAISANHGKALAELYLQRRRNAELIEALRAENAAKDEARRVAEEANASRTRLFAAANHDLRQPLQAIGLLSYGLTGQGQPAAVQETGRHIQSCVTSLGDLVDDMLELAQFDASVIQPRDEIFALSDLLAEALGAHRPLAEAKGLALHGCATDQWVRSDRRLVLRVLNNLLSNAVRYTRSGEIRVQVSQAGHRVEVSVADTGIGIAEADQHRIFEDFYQVNNPGRDRRAGLGLGLATARRISDLLGLGLSLKSSVGEFSIFSFGLAVTEAPARVSAPEAVTVAAPSYRQTVLLVEDDAVSGEALRSLLVSWGCSVRAESSARAAMEAVDLGFAPDLIVTDLRLGDGPDGLSLIAWLHAHAKRAVPAILITGDASANEVRSTPHGNVTVLRKPIKPAQLRALLNQVFAEPGTPARR